MHFLPLPHQIINHLRIRPEVCTLQPKCSLREVVTQYVFTDMT